MERPFCISYLTFFARFTIIPLDASLRAEPNGMRLAPSVSHWGLYRLHGFFTRKGAYMVLEIILKLVDAVTAALSFATAILLYINNRPGSGKH